MIRINNKDVEINKFPDGTLLIKEAPSYDIALISWFFESNEELVALIYLTNHLRSNGVKRIELYMPYVPNARQDRVKKIEDVFTLKYFAGVINSLGFDKVSVLDPHSSVSEALIEKISVESPKNYIENVIDDITRSGKYTNENGITQLMMFYPDEGAMKRYSGMIPRPYAFGIKDRDWSTGQIKGLKVAGSAESIKDNTILIVDDICSRGGTFYHSALKLKELCAKYNVGFEGEWADEDMGSNTGCFESYDGEFYYNYHDDNSHEAYAAYVRLNGESNCLSVDADGNYYRHECDESCPNHEECMGW